jgi:lipopolysaccharide transport system permease protein
MTAQASERIIVLEAGRPDARYWSDMWTFRELLLMLAKRDVLVRDRQTMIGILWGVLRPALNVLIFTLVFGVVARLPSEEGVPYPVLVMTGLLPWTLFSSALSDMSNSLLFNANMVSKIYFPRLLVPFSTIPVNLFDFVVSFFLLVAMMLFYEFIPSWKIIFLPVFVLLAVLIAAGPGLLFAALNVSYRDVRFIVPFVLSVGWLVSPVGFSSNIVPAQLQFIFTVNPLVALIAGFRWSILGQAPHLDWVAAAISLLLAAAFVVWGIVVFRKTERSFADVI